MSKATLTEQILAHLDAEARSGRSIRSIAAEIGLAQPTLYAIHRRMSVPSGTALDKLARHYRLKIVKEKQ